MRGLAPLIAVMAAGAASAALAAHTQDAVVYDPATGQVQMIVFPGDDAQLTDPAFNPPGLVQQRVPHQVNADPVVQARTLAPAANITLPGGAPSSAIQTPPDPINTGTGTLNVGTSP